MTDLAPGPASRGAMAAGLQGCVRDLVKAAVGTGYVPMGPIEAEELLSGLLSRFVDALYAEPFRTGPGYDLGAALVKADFTGPEMIGRTVKVLAGRLLGEIGADRPEFRERLAALVGGVSTGYARALRDRVREDQEETRRAMVMAQHLAAEAVRASEERRWWEARHDPVTGLPNREMLIERLTAAFSERPPETRLGLCVLGLDRFGPVNDSLGHDAGEELLRAVARRLEEQFRPAGHVVARMGGDEFAVLALGLLNEGDSDAIARAAFAALGRPFVVGPQRLRVPASAGVVERLVGETDATEVLRSAQVTLRWAKADGGGRWQRFDAERHSGDVARWALSAALPAALERAEFLVDYQPMVRLCDGTVRGVEALVRWRHPTRGVLGPDHFIALAEETGLIVPLGRWVLEQACQQAGRWQPAAPTGVAPGRAHGGPTDGPEPPFVSVNLAVHQTRDPGLLDDVGRVLAETGLPPSRLQLEVTESALIGPDSAALEALRALRGLGVRIAIDDFGTGFANYAHLRRLPVCDIKLAAAFLDGLRGDGAPNPLDLEVVNGLVDLAHAMGLTVTAEGVETAAQAQRLRELHCDAAQGYHLGRPCAPERLLEMLAGPPHSFGPAD
jgi:diguanylate cyclase (GGDEF)-like protein